MAMDILCQLEHFQHIEAKQNGRHFADDIFKRIFLNENFPNSNKINFVEICSLWSIENNPALVRIMAWPLSEPLMAQFNDTYIRHSASVS